MILKTYIFGNASGEYKQYPKDSYSENFISSFCSQSNSQNQIAVHRNGNLMYYAYCCKYREDFYGVCIVCGELCLNPSSLYEKFQQIINDSAQKGILFRYDRSGNIKFNINNVSSEQGEIEAFFQEVKDTFDDNAIWAQILSEDYTIPQNAKVNFSLNEDSPEKIVDAIRHYHNILITLENPIPTSFAMTVKRLNEEKEQLQIETNNLMNRIQDLTRQKKQYKIVILLVIILLIGGIITAVVIYNKNEDIENKIARIDSLERNVESLQRTKRELKINIEHLNDSIGGLMRLKAKLENDYEIEHNNLIEVTSKYDNLTSVIGNNYPFIVTGTEFNFNSGYFRVNYYGLRVGNYTVRVNVYIDNSYGNRMYSDSYSRYIYSGYNSMSFYLTRSLNSSSWYYFEICCGSKIVGGDKH